MIVLLTDIRDRITSGGGGNTSELGPDSSVLPPDSSLEAPDPDDGWSFLDLAKALKDGMWTLTKGTIKTAFGGFTSLLSVPGTIKDGFDAIKNPGISFDSMSAWDGSFDFEDVPAPDTSTDTG